MAFNIERLMLRLFCAMIFACVLMSCEIQHPEERLLGANEIARACVLWEKKRMTNYDMIVRYKHGGMIPSASPVIIEVRCGEAVNIRPIVGDQRPTDYYSSVDTVDKVLERVRQNIAEDSDVWGAFDSEYGYPTRVRGRFPNGSYHFYDLRIDELVPR